MGSCVALLPDLSRRRECAPLTAGKMNTKCKKIKSNNERRLEAMELHLMFKTTFRTALEVHDR